MLSGLNQQRRTILLGAILILAAVLRLANLGACSFRGDEFTFLTAKTGLFEIWENPPFHNQIPFAESICILFNKLPFIQTSQFTIRVPFAILGVASVAALFFCLRRIAGGTIALIATLLCAINPAHIYLSREAYHYIGVILFSTLSLWAFWNCYSKLQAKKMPPWKDWLLWMGAGLVMCHTHMSTWFFMAAQGTILCGYGVASWRDDKQKLVVLIRRLLAGGGITLLVMSRWILRAFGEFNKGNAKRATKLGDWSKFWQHIGEVIPNYSSGAWVGGWIVLALLIGGLVWLAFKSREERTKLRGVGIVFLPTFILLVCVIAVIGKGRVKATYFATLYPFILLIMAYGIKGLADCLGSLTKLKKPLPCTLLLIAMASFWAVPVRAVLELPGKPYPYGRIQEWIESNLPDRKLLAVRNACIQVQMRYYTPKGIKLSGLWPLSAPQNMAEKRALKQREKMVLHKFAEQFPDAIVLDYDRVLDTQLDDSFDWELGKFYRCRKVFTNRQAMLLRKIKIVPQPAFGDETLKGTLSALSYNRPADMEKLARARGEEAAILFGAGWQHAKTRDYRNWRVMRDRALLKIRNPQAGSFRAILQIKAVAAGGTKSVRLNSQEKVVFPANKPLEKEIGPLNLVSGDTQLKLTSETPEIPLLVESIRVQRIAESTPDREKSEPK